MEKLKTYLPLIMVVLLSLAMSLAIHRHLYIFADITTATMGFFFCLLSMFKLFDIEGFADGFQMYDIIGKRFRVYAYAYPFIELILGLSYLAKTTPFLTNLITLVLMTISAIGVIKSVKAGMDLHCACLGTILKVPLSTVSIVENVAMGLMAAAHLILLLV